MGKHFGDALKKLSGKEDRAVSKRSIVGKLETFWGKSIGFHFLLGLTGQ